MKFSTALDQVLNLHGFDVDRADAAAIANERYATAVLESEYRLARYDLGAVVANQAAYSLPATTAIQSISSVYIGEDGEALSAVSWDELRALRAGQDSYLYGRPGPVWAETFDADGNRSVEFFPAPGTAGDNVYAAVALPPGELADDQLSEPIIPANFHRPVLVHGTIAELLRLDSEAQQDAAFYEGSYVAAIEGLRAHRASNVKRGPTRVRLAT